MKRITLFMLLMAGMALNAQIYYQLPVGSGNPGGLNADNEYPVGGGLDASWTVVLGPSNASPTWSTTQTIPFTFKFNNVTETSFKVSSSGVLTFDAGTSVSAPSYTNATLPSASIPDKSVAIWGITGIGSSDQIVKKVFGTAPNRQLWVFFSSYTMGSTTASWSYWSIVMEETTNNIYIVDQRNANGTLAATVGVQVNSTIAYSVAGSPSVGHLSGNDPSAADNFYYSFLPGPQPSYDMAGLAIKNSAYLSNASAPFTLQAEFANFGSQTITSATINYKVNGGATVSAPLTGLNIGSFANVTLNHPTAWNPGLGTYNVEMWLSNLNGNADEKTSNDMAAKQIIIVANLTPRKPLMETFTSSTCPPCVPANTNMEQIFAANPGEYVSIKYQMSWPGTGDPYYTLEGLTRRQLYGITAVPWMLIDGGWNENGNSLTQGIFDQYQQVPAFVNLGATYTVNGNTKTVTGTVTINPLANVSGNLNLFIAIKENRTTQNIKSNGETEFFQVMKKMVPNGDGEPLVGGLTAGTPITKNFTYTFNGNYTLPPNATAPVDNNTAHTVEEFFDLSVAVWIQNMTTKEVLQAANGVQTQYIGIDETGVANSLSVYPNPAADVAYVSVNMENNADANISMINTLGQVVLAKTANLESGSNKIELNTSDLASGVYFVQVEIAGNVETVKLSVK